MTEYSDRGDRDMVAMEQEKLAAQIETNHQLALIALNSFVLAVEALRPEQA